MRRRTLLATAGTMLFAGCGDIAEEVPVVGGDGTETGTTTTGPTTTETSVPTETETETLTDTPTETETPTGTETPTETETPTPSQAERTAAEQITTARDFLSDALSAYVGFAEDEESTLLDVDASVDVTPSAVTQPVSDARTALDEVPDGANAEQETTVAQLRGVGTVLGQGVRCQADLYDAYEEFLFVVDRIYAESLAGVPDNIGQLRSERDRAQGFFDTLEADSGAADMTAFEDISESTYTDKVEQFRAELDAFSEIADAMTTFRRGMDALEEAISAYREENYRTAREEFPTADSELAAVSDRLLALEAPDSVAEKVSEIVTVTNVLANGSREMARASRAGFEGRSSDRRDAFEAAEAAFRESEFVVDTIDSVENLID